MKFTAIPLLSICLLAGCAAGRQGPLDPTLTAFVPPNAVVLAGVRLDQLRATPLYRDLAAQNKLPRFDEYNGVHELLLAGDGQGFLAIGRGDVKPKPVGQQEAMAFPAPHTVLEGPPAMVQAAMDQWSAHRNVVPHDLLARAQSLPSDTQIWVVVAGWKGLSPEALRNMGNAANFDRVLRQVAGASVTIDLRTGIHAAATADCRTESDARELSDQLRGLAGLARMAVPKKEPDLLRVFDGLAINPEGRLLRLNLDVPQDLAAKLLNKQ